MFGTQTWGGRMEGTDKPTELWRHQKAFLNVPILSRKFPFLNLQSSFFQKRRSRSFFNEILFCSEHLVIASNDGADVFFFLQRMQNAQRIKMTISAFLFKAACLFAVLKRCLSDVEPDRLRGFQCDQIGRFLKVLVYKFSC